MNSRTTPGFWQRFNTLPPEVQQLAVKNYQVGLHYRATGVFLDDETFRWVWIGTHSEYDRL